MFAIRHVYRVRGHSAIGCLTARGFATETLRQQTTPFGFAFDIDGVLIKGHKVIPQTRAVLRFISGQNPLGAKIPFILLTNGGGITEQEKAEQLSKMFEIEISPDQLVLSHSPMRALVDTYADKLVLVLGGRGKSCKNVAYHYGFRRVVQANDVYAWNRSIWPFKATETWLSHERFDFEKEPIQAIMMFHDSCDWGTEMQVALDALLARDGYLGTMRSADDTSPQMPVYFSNPDLLWSNDFPLPRFAQGAFRVALEALYKDVTGKKLEYTLYGKPETATYQYAERTILRQLSPMDQQMIASKPLRVYAGGDNPSGDIAGANRYGWTSILVRTGVFQGGDNDPNYPATYVADHVGAAVQWAFERETGIKVPAF